MYFSGLFLSDSSWGPSTAVIRLVITDQLISKDFLLLLLPLLLLLLLSSLQLLLLVPLLLLLQQLLACVASDSVAAIAG
jgi:hypothetical protein